MQRQSVDWLESQQAVGAKTGQAGEDWPTCVLSQPVTSKQTTSGSGQIWSHQSQSLMNVSCVTDPVLGISLVQSPQVFLKTFLISTSFMFLV